MAKKRPNLITIFILGTVLTVVCGMYFYNSPLFPIFQNWVSANILVFCLFLLVIKIVGLVWPPLPGGLFTFASVSVLGWQLAFAIDFIGNLVGASLAWILGRMYGEGIIENLFSQKTVNKIKRIKIRKEHELEGVFLFSLASGVIMVEFANYVLGWQKVKYLNFLIANTVAHLIRNAPIFYLFESTIAGQNVFINLIVVLLALPPLIFLWKRYVHLEEVLP